MGRTKKPKFDAYQVITDRFIEALNEVISGERKALPWRWSWTGGCGGLPRNGISNRPYTGMNRLLLLMSGYGDSRWYTFNAVKKSGKGHVRKGEKGTKVTFWKKVTVKPKDGDDTDKPQERMFLRVFTVFNHEQIEWEVVEEEPAKSENTESENNDLDITDAMEFLNSVNAEVRHGGGSAHYDIRRDFIQMPPRKSFNTEQDYVAVLAHEHVHWTGAESRCNREGITRKGKYSYAFEELVAEFGSAFLCADLGIQTPELDKNHQAYLEVWVKRLTEDKKAIFKAVSQARKAVEFLTEAAESNNTEAVAKAA